MGSAMERNHGVVLENIEKKFGHIVVLDNFSIEVKKGEYLFLVGPSGCGKSVILRLIAGLEEPDSGAIYIGGREMKGIPACERNTPVVFQNYALFPHMSVADNVEYPLKIRNLDQKRRKKKTWEMLELVDLLEMASKRPNQISGGQKQRVALARSLMTEPEVLLLDEPLGALDANLHARMSLELRALHEKLGITFIQVTHDKSDALAVGDRIAVMNQGKVEQLGTPMELFARPRTRAVAEFMRNSNILSGEVHSLDGETVSVVNSLGLFQLKVADVPEGLESGKNVSFAVRYDQVRLSMEGLENQVVAIMRRHEVTGPLMNYIFELANGQEFRLELPTGSDIKFDSGEEVSLGWRSVDCYLIPG